MKQPNPIDQFNQTAGEGQQVQPMNSLQSFFSLPQEQLPGPHSVSIPIRVVDQSGQRNCQVYLNFPPMELPTIQLLISQMKAMGLDVADRSNNYGGGGYNKGYRDQYHGGGYRDQYQNRGYQNYGPGNGGWQR